MSFRPIAATVTPNGIYLNAPSTYYTIDISIDALGSSYIPDPNDPYNEAGSWNITNIFAGTEPSNGIVPTSTFSLSQQLVTFYIQNVGGVPINVVFASNDIRGSYSYFSFGVPPSQTPDSYTLDPLSILIVQTVFTSNNVIRFYNSFVDALNFNQLYRIFDQANKVGYYDTTTVVGAVPVSKKIVTSSNTTLPLATIVKEFCQIDVTTEAPMSLAFDGTDLPGDAVALIIVNANSAVSVSLVELVGIDNYKGHSVPSHLPANTTWFFVVDSTRVSAYDGTSTSQAGTITRSYPPL